MRRTQRVFGDIEAAFTGDAVRNPHCLWPRYPATRRRLHRQTLCRGAGSASATPRSFWPRRSTSSTGKPSSAASWPPSRHFPLCLRDWAPHSSRGLFRSSVRQSRRRPAIYDAYSAHHEAQRDFEREKSRRLALAQQVADTGRNMRWALNHQCLVDQIRSSARSRTRLRGRLPRFKGEAAILEAPTGQCY